MIRQMHAPHVLTAPSNHCMLCERDDGTITALICDRCNEEVHMSCLDPPLTKVPEGW